jgi:plasmid stabilization system protein ParE
LNVELKIQFHESAAEEMETALAWYETRSPKAADRLFQELTGLLDQIAGSPQTFAFTESGHRRAVLRRYPFIVIFVERPKYIYVLAVAHAKRRPGYWRNRQIS